MKNFEVCQKHSAARPILHSLLTDEALRLMLDILRGIPVDG